SPLGELRQYLANALPDWVLANLFRVQDERQLGVGLDHLRRPAGECNRVVDTGLFIPTRLLRVWSARVRRGLRSFWCRSFWCRSFWCRSFWARWLGLWQRLLRGRGGPCVPLLLVSLFLFVRLRWWCGARTRRLGDGFGRVHQLLDHFDRIFLG